MDDLAKYIPVAAAIAFTCAAAMLLGQAIGLGNIALFSEYTFSDVVNSAPVGTVSFGFVLLWSFLDNEKRRIEQEKFERPLVPISLADWRQLVKAGVVAIALIVGAFFIKPEVGFSMAVVCGLVGVLYGRLFPALHTRVKTELANWMERWCWVVIMMFAYGVSTASLAHNPQPARFTVHTERGCFKAATIMQIDRGVVLIRGDGFELVPWDKVLSVSNTLNPTASNDCRG